MRISLAFVLLLAMACPARAADPAIDEAKAHVRAATAAYNLGHYNEAAGEYEAAYRQTLDPNLLFNIGQSYRLAGDRDKAIIAYRSFLRSGPRGEQRGLAESKLRDLEQQDVTLTPARAIPPAAAPATTASPAVAVPALAPTPSQNAAGTSLLPPQPAGVAVVEPSPPEPGREPSPFYTRWPFWTAVGVAVAGGVVLAVILSQRGSSNLDMGSPSLGSQEY
jgi:tetratricopeptide (TPR) repeat protein